MSIAALFTAVAMAQTSPQYSAALAGKAEAMWELPTAAPPHAVLFVAHGCSHAATDFWAPSKACPKALGLPEEVRLRKMALAAGYAVIGISSQDRNSGCWHFELDGDVVKDALAAWFTLTNLPPTLPLVAFGASSGGAFVLQLPGLVPNLRAVVSQIMAVPPSMLSASHPPTMFVHMPRDQRTAAFVSRCMKRLAQAGVAAREVEVQPVRPTAGFFLKRIERLAPATAIKLHDALKRSGLLNASGHLADDPRRSPWREAIRSTPGLLEALPGPSPDGAPDSLIGDESAVSEALNVAWAMHEIVSDPTEDMLRWLAELNVGFKATSRASVEASSELR